MVRAHKLRFRIGGKIVFFVKPMKRMETVIVTLKHARAKKLLEELAEPDLIILTEPTTPSDWFSAVKITGLKNLMQEPMDEEAIDKQLEELRNEWERNF